MICKKCGKEIPDQSLFCPECGYKIGEDNIQEEPTKKKLLQNKKPIIVAVAAAVLVVGVVAGIYLNSTPEAKYNKAEKAFVDGDYKKAIQYYTAAGNYEDAQAKLGEAELADHRASGLSLIEQGSFEEAKEELELAEGYGDSGELIKQCNYKIAEGYAEKKEYLAAAKSFSAAEDYEDADDRIMELGKELVSASKCEDAVKVYDYAKDWSTDLYAQYANGVVNFNAKKYSDAVKNFSKASGILDAKEQYHAAQYAYASGLLSEKEYSEAKEGFEEIIGYSDSSDLVNACDLMIAKVEMAKGNLNTAKAALEKLPKEYVYDNVSVSALLDQLNANGQWLALCGKWTSTSGEMKSVQTGDYGYERWWTSEFEEGDRDIDVRCKFNDDGSVTVVTKGNILAYTNYSAISAGLKWENRSVNINERASDMGTVQVDDLTSITFSPSGISVAYKKVDNSQDVYFTYTYQTNITYGKRVEAY